MGTTAVAVGHTVFVGTHVGLARTAADLGKEQVDTEWRVLVDKVILNGLDLRTSTPEERGEGKGLA